MKKSIKAIFCLTVALVMVFSALTIVTSAASASIAFGSGNKTSYNVGDTVTVNITFKSGGKKMFGMDGTLEYDSSLMQFVSGGTNSGSSVRVVDSELSGETSKSYSFTFKALKSGSCYFKFSGEASDENLTRLNASTGYTVKVKESNNSSSDTSSSSKKSDNANLSSIKLSNGTLSPKFNKNTKNYTATVPNTVTSVKISATTEDKNATFEISGSNTLSVGSNKRTITVKAENGDKNIYTVTIKREKEEDDDTSSDVFSSTSDQQSSDIGTSDLDEMDVIVGNDVYTIQENRSGLALPLGYSENKQKYLTNEITVLESEKSSDVLYILKSKESGKCDYFTLDINNGEFSLLKYLIVDSQMYIFADDGITGEPEGYTKTSAALGNDKADVYVSEDTALADFYVFYAELNGEKQYYRYDSLEGTIQRAPEFVVILKNLKASDSEQTMSSVRDFGKISGYGKAVIFVIAIIIICVIALIVLVIIRFVKLRQQDEMDDMDYNDTISLFDEITVENNEDDSDIEKNLNR